LLNLFNNSTHKMPILNNLTMILAILSEHYTHPERTCPEGLPRRIHRERSGGRLRLGVSSETRLKSVRTLPKADPLFYSYVPKSISDSIHCKRHITYVFKFVQKPLCFEKKSIKLIRVFSKLCCY
jgi:hypothetical protein